MISLTFKHGLGDAVYCAHLLALYVRRGFSFTIKTFSAYNPLFVAAGCTTTHSRVPVRHPWLYPPEQIYEGEGYDWCGNKPFGNLSQPPLPNIGRRGDLWDEFTAVRLGWMTRSAEEERPRVDAWLATLPRPIVLLHSTGNSGQSQKSIPAEDCLELYRAFADRRVGTLVLLDWHDRVPRGDQDCVVHLSQLGSCELVPLLWLIQGADLMVGVDSGPLHLARLTNTRTLGVWRHGYYPARYSLPRDEQRNLVLDSEPWNRWKREVWQLVEVPALSGPHIVTAIEEFLHA
jgi:hypothetical protein